MTNEITQDASQAQPQTYYDVLGVRPDAPQSRVHDAYVAALKYLRENYHEDPNAQAGLDRVRLAYKVIGNPEGRAAYNTTLNLEAPAQRKWKPYLEDEEESLRFWTDFASTGIWFLVIGPWALLLRGVIWLGSRIGSLVSGKSGKSETGDSGTS